jgi:LytS/YehU family sensor histidine kinase
MHRRGHETEQRLLATQQERARLLRSAFDARLTAMRAQVDPQFLFDSLGDVQKAYAQDSVRGAATLDRLIVYLRTALPRLRTEGSTIGAEAELVEAWLAVVAARRDGHPRRQIEVDADCSNAPFPATVLLPLVQWSAGDGGQPGCTAVSLRAQRLRQVDAGRLLVRLRVAPGRPCCDDDAELRRIRDRLRAMYGEAANLTCAREAIQDGWAGSGSATVVTLFWPDESAERDRR